MAPTTTETMLQHGSPRPETGCYITSLPKHVDTIRQVRTGKVRPAFADSELTGIFKTPNSTPVKVGIMKCEGDESAYIHHCSPDNALMHYASQHYELWQKEIPENAHHFTVGGFGENIVSGCLDEDTVCIGDIMQLGKEVIIQVSKPRQPCYKLNHRFELQNMSLLSQNLNRTGWYYRVLKEGLIQVGDDFLLLERKYPQWTVKNIQNYLYKDIKNETAMKELAYLPELGAEIRNIFRNRLTKKEFLDNRGRLEGGSQNVVRWKEYRLLSKRKEASKICSFIFEAVQLSLEPTEVQPGSHVRVKLGVNRKLVRAYSVVGGSSNRFELGIAREGKASRGGSKFMHDELAIGDTLMFSEMSSDFPLHVDATRHILIAGGVGITAFIPTARKLQDQNFEYHLYYAVRSSNDIAFQRYLDPLAPHFTVLNGSKGERLDIKKILGEANSGTHLYVCGPERLLSAINLVAEDLNLPRENIHSEAFTVSTSGDPFTVSLDKSNKKLEVPQEQSLLDVLRDAGFEIPSSCEVGNCGTCRVGVCSGRVEHRGTGLLDGEKMKSMLSCVSRGIGNIVVDL